VDAKAGVTRPGIAAAQHIVEYIAKMFQLLGHKVGIL
jgi:hypothetical protein